MTSNVSSQKQNEKSRTCSQHTTVNRDQSNHNFLRCQASLTSRRASCCKRDSKDNKGVSRFQTRITISCFFFAAVPVVHDKY
eukprot:5443072-Pleurochrysis_carterae.AAC.1